FGLHLTITRPGGAILGEFDFKAAPFSDIWRRALTGGGDEGASVFYQSVLHVSSWGDLASSPLLQALKGKTEDDLLSIKLNLDGYSMARGTSKFGYGRINGTIGPSRRSEPHHWVDGRQIGDQAYPFGSAYPGFTPDSGVNYFSARYDEARKKIL